MSNSKNLSNSEQVEGNTKTSTNTDNFQCWKWVGTFHIDENSSFKNIFELIELKIIPLCDKYIFGEEYGESGETPHIQFAFTLKKKTRMRRKALQKLFGKEIWLDRMKGTLPQQSYCGKESNKIITNIHFPKPLKKLACEDNIYKYQENICKILRTEPDDRSIFWYYGEGEIGKTTFCKYIFRTFENVVVLGGKSADMKNGIIEYKKNTGFLPEIILINLPRSFNNDYLSYTGIEEVKDMFFYSGKYEGGMIDGNCPHLFIFSNERPDVSKMSKDRWRIKQIISVGKDFYAKSDS